MWSIFKQNDLNIPKDAKHQGKVYPLDFADFNEKAIFDDGLLQISDDSESDYIEETKEIGTTEQHMINTFDDEDFNSSGLQSILNTVFPNAEDLDIPTKVKVTKDADLENFGFGEVQIPFPNPKNEEERMFNDFDFFR